MTPTPPSGSNPLIYRIADALGVFHLVAPVNHTHSASEVEGLADALAAKANAVPAGSPSGGIVIAATSGELARSNKTVQDLLDAIAAKMDNKTIDNTPTANSTNLVTSGGVKTALGGKADTNHTHTPTEVQGVIPSFVEWTGQTLDLDTIIDGTLGMVRLMIYNNDSTDTTFGDLFESLESLPIHLNANAATAIETQHYALCTIYKMDKSQTPSEHDHDLCYFITLDGVFGDGNPSV